MAFPEASHFRSGEDGTANSVDPSVYSDWADPTVALRDALSRDPIQVERDRVAWASWLKDRGVETSWRRRLPIDDRRFGAVVVTEEPHQYLGPSPQVYGDISDPHRDTPLVLSSDGARFWRTSNATVVGGWDVVSTPDGACWPALTQKTESILVSNALDARLLGWTPSFMILRANRESRLRRALSAMTRTAPRQLDRAITLVGEHSAQYGHFVIDYLARALAVERLPASVPVLIDEDVPANSIWWLTRILPNRLVIRAAVGECLEVRDLIVPLQRTFCPTGWIDSMELTPSVWSSDPASVSRIQNLVTAGVDVSTRYKRVWLGKRGGNKVLANQQELFDRVAPHGFQLVYPEDLPMSGLQGLLNETKDVIAPVGSHVLNVIASVPGLRVLVLLGEAMIQARGSTAISVTASGHELAFVGGHDVGPEGNNPYERKQRSSIVDTQLLNRACDGFFAPRT